MFNPGDVLKLKHWPEDWGRNMGECEILSTIFVRYNSTVNADDGNDIRLMIIYLAPNKNIEATLWNTSIEHTQPELLNNIKHNFKFKRSCL